MPSGACCRGLGEVEGGEGCNKGSMIREISREGKEERKNTTITHA
jgi:hypothetical protein